MVTGPVAMSLGVLARERWTCARRRTHAAARPADSRSLAIGGDA